MNNLTRKGAVHDILLGSLRHKVRGISLAQDTVHVQELHHLVDLRGVGVGDQAGKPQLALGVPGGPDLGLLDGSGKTMSMNWVVVRYSNIPKNFQPI